MAEIASFNLRMTGGLADRHEFEAYDGYISLAGAARTLTLVTHYVETGAIRQKGEFSGRHLVHALPMTEGSLLARFSVALSGRSADTFGIDGGVAGTKKLLYGLVHRVVTRNVGVEATPLNDEVAKVIAERSGDIEKLVEISESPLERAHDAIGNGIENVEWFGGFNSIANLNRATKAYINTSVHDQAIYKDIVTVTGFYGNSGHGSIWDADLGHNVSISMHKDTLIRVGRIFSWGLDQYTNHTGKQIVIEYSMVTAIDGRPKKYIIHSAGYAP